MQQESVRFQIVMELTVDEAPRSTCHHALASTLVCVTEPSAKMPSLFPSIALEAAVVGPYIEAVLLCVATFPSARLFVTVSLKVVGWTIVGPVPVTVNV